VDLASFHEGVNLMPFCLAEVFVFHKQLRLPGQEALNAIHPQPPNYQLIKLHFVLEFAKIRKTKHFNL
jgi:hypothetical protein